MILIILSLLLTTAAYSIPVDCTYTYQSRDDANEIKFKVDVNPGFEGVATYQFMKVPGVTPWRLKVRESFNASYWDGYIIQLEHFVDTYWVMQSAGGIKLKGKALLGVVDAETKAFIVVRCEML